MEELKSINSKISKKQIGRIIGACFCGVCGIKMLISFCYQKGITDCQKAIRDFYPEEYELLTKKVLQTFEKEGVTKF